MNAQRLLSSDFKPRAEEGVSAERARLRRAPVIRRARPGLSPRQEHTTARDLGQHGFVALNGLEDRLVKIVRLSDPSLDLDPPGDSWRGRHVVAPDQPAEVSDGGKGGDARKNQGPGRTIHLSTPEMSCGQPAAPRAVSSVTRPCSAANGVGA